MPSPAETLRAAYPELVALGATAPDPVYLVGGAVRDLLVGRGRADVDLVVEGDPERLAAALGAPVLAAHPTFGTLRLRLGDEEIDVAAARTETYVAPGELPEVRTGATLAVDLGRRDFTVNAMAIPLAGEMELIDPFGGGADLEGRLLRVLHPESFVDDPTRALRAARYAARLGFALEPETEMLLRKADLTTVSPERRAAELERLAAESSGVRGLALLAEWGLIEPHPGRLELAERVATLLDATASGESESAAPWREVDRASAVLAAALGPAAAEEGLAAERPERPSEAVALARGRDEVELVLARALGAEWLDSYFAQWREVRLEIDGTDLVAAGIEPGPAIGRGLAAALDAKLDAPPGAPQGREAELAVALAAARGA